MIGLPVAAQNAFMRLLAPQQAQMTEEEIRRMFGQIGGGGQPGPMQQSAPQQVMPNTALADMAGPARRERVNPLNVIGRVLAPETFGAIDAERTRLQAQADLPQRNARLAAALSNIDDPIERAAFLGLGSNEWRENASKRFAPITTAQGSVTTYGAGPNARQVAPLTVDRFDDRYGYIDPLNPQAGVQYTAPRGATQSEQTAQDRLTWDQQYGGQRLNIDQQQADTGRMNAETTRASAGFTASPGQIRYATDGTPIAENTNLSPQAETARQQAADKAANARTTNLRNVTNTLGAVDTALRQANSWTSGPASVLAAVPGTPQADLKATLETIEANLAFGALAEMRANSPTGGALGGIAVRELDLLGATLANLRQSQSPEQLRRNLNTVKQSLSTLQDIYNDQQAAGPTSGGSRSSGPIAQDAQGNRVQWNGSAWVPL